MADTAFIGLENPTKKVICTPKVTSRFAVKTENVTKKVTKKVTRIEK